ncbi:MAG TPA: lysophospholipid acyltransferase family protein, partial [Bacteroidota bacterium]
RLRPMLLSAWIWTAIALLILLWYPLLWIVSLTDRDPVRYRTGRWFRRLGVAMTKVNPLWNVELSGGPVADPRNPYVVVSNHQSSADIPIISHLPWEMKWVAKTELFRVPLVGGMLRLAGDIEVNRADRRSGARMIVTAERYLKGRCSVMVFPEGTRSMDGRVGSFSDGAFHLAVRAGVPVLPLAVDGSRSCLPKRSWFFGKPSTIRVRILPQVETAGLGAADIPALRERVRSLIIAQVAAWRSCPVEEVDALRNQPAG